MASFSRSSDNIPRNRFIAELIEKTSNLEDMIYVHRVSVIAVFPAMKGIIQTLNEEAQKDLNELKEKIVDWRRNKRKYDREAVEDAYGELMAYLHTGYLKEVNYAAKPKYTKKAHLKVPK